MSAKISTIAILFIFATITPALAQCDTGSLNCCNSVQDYNSPTVGNLLGPLQIILQGLEGQAGVDCTPVTVMGGEVGSNCDSHSLCCTGGVKQSGNLVAVGCTPFSIG
ncbi:hypothetical protein JAAARDRAFT_203827 [Jaapia argillacea MUCL 33604]|uniref:Hydrophobin n=1 Tax=Jaapia argillacea MUCL 33604 TaxID=933084 RepID=A0A067Q712_9AGAM|nr:hypothetical protein JAAARDRAFT_203827 [Jaapia argillacea MUCL 33604]